MSIEMDHFVTPFFNSMNDQKHSTLCCSNTLALNFHLNKNIPLSLIDEDIML